MGVGADFFSFCVISLGRRGNGQKVQGSRRITGAANNSRDPVKRKVIQILVTIQCDEFI